MPKTDKPSFFKDFVSGAGHVLKTVWEVPQARTWLATVLVRAGIPSSLIAVGIAIGDKLVH